MLQCVVGVELAAQELEKKSRIEANTFRISCANTIRRAEPPGANLTSRQRKALTDLWNNQSITILTADKGGKVVLLDTIAYADLCIGHLSDPAYESVSSFGVGRGKVNLRDEKGNLLQDFEDTDFRKLDPGDKLLKMQCRRLMEMLTNLRNSGQISSEDRKRVIPGQPYSGVLPHFYTLPKIHKVGRLRIRPIVSNIGIYCDKLLLHLKSVLNVVFRGEFAVLNSYDLVERLDQLELDSKDRLASFDVESLFTRVLVDNTLDIVQTRLQEMMETEEGKEELQQLTSLTVQGFMSLLCLVVKDFYFVWHGHLHRQIMGLPMGSHLSPVLANIFMEELESSILRVLPIQPKIYVCFVDDIFIIFNSEQCNLDNLLYLFNNYHQDINLTCEHESDCQLPFLDLLVRQMDLSAHPEQRSIDLSIWRKPTHSHHFLHYQLSHPLELKRNGLRSQWLRAQRLL